MKFVFSENHEDVAFAATIYCIPPGNILIIRESTHAGKLLLNGSLFSFFPLFLVNYNHLHDTGADNRIGMVPNKALPQLSMDS